MNDYPKNNILILENIREKSLKILEVCNTEAYSESCQASKMDSFAETINSLNSLTIFAKVSILDV